MARAEALILILFEGGLDSKFREILKNFGPGFSLSTLSDVLSMAAVAGVSLLALLFSWLNALLIGAVLGYISSSTLLPVLQQIDMRREVKVTLLVEASFGDAFAIPAVVFRSLLVLMASTGMANRRIAHKLNTSRPTVILWRQRFLQGGPVALVDDAPGLRRRSQITAQKIKQIVEATLQTKPKAATHWSVRAMAAAQGISPATVQRIWDAHGLEPHRTRGFKLSRDKRFVEKLTDVVALYLNPPGKALVLCIDEKSQIQALDRTQPGLPMKKGRCGTMTHDYKRNGTTTLFAALNVLEGTRVENACRAIAIKSSCDSCGD